MIDADDYLLPLGARGFDFFTGVPCSFLTPLIDKVVAGATAGRGSTTCRPAARARRSRSRRRAWLAGRGTVVMFQNSGLGNAVNPLTSLNHPFRMPLGTARPRVASTAIVARRPDENFFRVRFDRLTPPERQYIRAMAEFPSGFHRTGDIANSLGVKITALGPVRATSVELGNRALRTATS